MRHIPILRQNRNQTYPQLNANDATNANINKATIYPTTSWPPSSIAKTCINKPDTNIVRNIPIDPNSRRDLRPTYSYIVMRRCGLFVEGIPCRPQKWPGVSWESLPHLQWRWQRNLVLWYYRILRWSSTWWKIILYNQLIYFIHLLIHLYLTL